jgi:fused
LFHFYRELNIDGANQTLRIVKNLIDAGSCQPSAATDGIICIFLDFTSLIIRTKLSDAYGLAVKVIVSDILYFLFTINVGTS